jgi:hypothetical protein
MFPNQIRLKINKRLKNDEDRKRMDDIKRDTFDQSIPFEKTIQKYFKMTDQPSDNNISYRNEVAADVSATKRKLLNKTGEYEVGEKIMCSEFLKSSGYIIQKDGKQKSIPIKFNKNCSYEIVEISEETMIIKDVQKDILPISNITETGGYTILSDNMTNEYTLIKRYDNFIVISYDIYTTLKT